MTDFIALAVRCEEATGPDRELDVTIAVAVDWRWPDWEEGEATASGQAAKHGLDWLVGRALSGASMWRNIPAYTASLDAAMSLADGFDFGAGRDKPDDDGPDGWAWVSNKREAFEIVRAATPALALTAACLRARSLAEQGGVL